MCLQIEDSDRIVLGIVEKSTEAKIIPIIAKSLRAKELL